MSAPQPHRTRRIRTVSLIGFAMYVVSYFLPAVHAEGSAWRGWEAALLTLEAVRTPPGPHEAIGEYLAMLVSSWINPLFLVSFALALRNPYAPTVAVLRVALLVMFGACWVVFRAEHATPTVGYFVWIVSMAAALFADKLVPPEDEPLAEPGR
jgi:hypothetical protein